MCFNCFFLNRDKGNVMNRLYDIAENCISKTKFFKNFDQVDNLDKNEREYRLQNGIVRVNCVDCLDRTNTAMYVIGKCALAHQVFICLFFWIRNFILLFLKLNALGILSMPRLGPESLCERMLIDLYEKCGYVKN